MKPSHVRLVAVMGLALGLLTLVYGSVSLSCFPHFGTSGSSCNPGLATFLQLVGVIFVVLSLSVLFLSRRRSALGRGIRK